MIRSWSDYTNCLDHVDVAFHSTMNTLTITGLSISLGALVLSLMVFFSFPSLHCTRITLHKNMFFSMAMNNISWLLWYHLVLFNPSVWSVNSFWCRLLHIMTTYFMLTTYFWMLCEGTYLRMILVKTFIEEESWVWWFAILGWIIPVIVLAPYTLFRLGYENQLCWMDNGKSIIFLAIPAICPILINIYCLCDVIRILRSKLIFENSFNKNNHNITMKSARAALILIPVFGLHFLLLPMRPAKGSSMEFVYEVVSSISTSTQGLFVSFLLCFTNDDVLLHIKNRLLRVIRKL